MHHCPSVANHKDELRVGKQVLQIDGRPDCERVLVAQSTGWLAVPHDDFENEGTDRRVENLGGDASLLESLRLKRRLGPRLSIAENSRYHTGLFAAPNLRMGIQQHPKQGGATARHSTDEDQWHVAVVGKPLLSVHIFLRGGAID